VEDGEQAFELLMEQWRRRAFAIYESVRTSQRERGAEMHIRLSALTEAGAMSRRLADEIASLNAAVLSDCWDETGYGVPA